MARKKGKMVCQELRTFVLASFFIARRASLFSILAASTLALAPGSASRREAVLAPGSGLMMMRTTRGMVVGETERSDVLRPVGMKIVAGPSHCFPSPLSMVPRVTMINWSEVGSVKSTKEEEDSSGCAPSVTRVMTEPESLNSLVSSVSLFTPSQKKGRSSDERGRPLGAGFTLAWPM
eukprot:3174455-Pleurochrysis_carterae.AAC.2